MDCRKVHAGCECGWLAMRPTPSRTDNATVRAFVHSFLTSTREHANARKQHNTRTRTRRYNTQSETVEYGTISEAHRQQRQQKGDFVTPAIVVLQVEMALSPYVGEGGGGEGTLL